MPDPIPTEFTSVTAVAKANVYFDGKVVSHTLRLVDGTKKTLGIIFPGTYHFDTDAPERMEMTAGHCRVKVDGRDAWTEYPEGSVYDLPGKSGFEIEVAGGVAQYICSFL